MSLPDPPSHPAPASDAEDAWSLRARCDALAAQLAQVQQQAHELALSRTQLLTALAHEIRTPLGAISAAAEVLDNPSTLPGTAREAREVIVRQARTLSLRLQEVMGMAAQARNDANAQARQAASTAPTATHRPDRPRQVWIAAADACAAELRLALEQQGHRVAAAEGRATLARLLDLLPEVALVEAGADGHDSAALQFAREARAAGFPGRLLAVLGPGVQDAPRHVLAAGFDGVLRWPCEAKLLSQVLSDG